MKTVRISRSAGGSAMILALLLVAVVGVLATAWITLIGARSGMVEQTRAASQRRVALENSKALAQEFMLERVMTSASGNAFEYSLFKPDPDDPEKPPVMVAGVTIPGWNSAAMLSVQKSAGVNHFSPGNGDGYTLDVSAAVRDSASSFSRKYQVRSRSPLFAGTLLDAQTPTLTPSASVSIGSLDVRGGAFVWTPNLSMSFTANSYSAPDSAAAVSFTNSAGAVLAMNNLALPRQISNPRGSGLLYAGQLDAIDNTDAAANSSAAKATSGGITVNGSTALNSNGVVCDGAGNVTITLNTQGLTNVYIPGEISNLTLEGQSAAGNAAADDLPAILIVVNQAGTSSRDLTAVTLNQHNSRRVDLAVKKAASTANLLVQFTAASASWRLVFEAENTPVSITAAGAATIQGGIRSDRSVGLAGSARITLESDPKFLERLATRTAWIESFAQ